MEDAETLDRVIPRSSDQHDGSAAIEGLTDKNGYVEPELRRLVSDWRDLADEIRSHPENPRMAWMGTEARAAELEAVLDAARSPDVVLNGDGEPVCVCSLTHRCAACRDGLVQGLGALPEGWAQVAFHRRTDITTEESP